MLLSAENAPMLVFCVLPRSSMLPQAHYRPIDGQDVKFGTHLSALCCLVEMVQRDDPDRMPHTLTAIINDRTTRQELACLFRMNGAGSRDYAGGGTFQTGR